MAAKEPALEEQSFEILMTRLAEIVDKLEDETVSLDDSIQLHAQALELVQVCKSRLNDAQQKIQKLVQDGDGNLEGKDLDE